MIETLVVGVHEGVMGEKWRNAYDNQNPVVAYPSGILCTTRSLSSDEVARLRERWDKAYGQNASRCIILNPGERFTVLDPGRFDLASLRDRQERLPVPVPFPFNLGPQGSLILLGGLLAIFGVVVAVTALASL